MTINQGYSTVRACAHPFRHLERRESPILLQELSRWGPLTNGLPRS
jgi:hypothetical protein